jgi:hypothetical protein
MVARTTTERGLVLALHHIETIAADLEAMSKAQGVRAIVGLDKVVAVRSEHRVRTLPAPSAGSARRNRSSISPI